MQTPASARILAMAGRQAMLRAADVRAAGLPSQLLIKLHGAGKLQRVARGLYSLPDQAPTEHQTLAEVCQQIPKAVICLLSALQFHEIGSQQPHEVWIALPEGAQSPRIDYPPLRITRLRGQAYAQGVGIASEHGTPLRIYGVAKTITDCFKFRNKVGLDVALEALKDAWRQRRATMEELTHYARINRVERVMQPYLQALTA